MFSERKVHKSPFDKEFMDFELQVEEKYAVKYTKLLVFY
jgi:hypothetical protein